MTRQYVPARLEDNPSLLQQDPGYEARLEGLGDSALVRALRHGDWDIVAGGLFDDLWSRERHVAAPFRIHCYPAMQCREHGSELSLNALQRAFDLVSVYWSLHACGLQPLSGLPDLHSPDCIRYPLEGMR